LNRPTINAVSPRTASLVVALLASLALGGCSFISGLFGGDKPPPAPKEVAMKPPPEAKLQISIVASPLINPDLDGRPSSVVVRLYQLASAENFKNADFALLYENDAKALGKSLLASTETIIEPGGIQLLDIPKVNPDTTFIGAVVGFRDFSHAAWRVVYPLKGEKKTAITCSLTRLAVELKDTPQ
jgi:type VI secretion system protein VasD